MKFTITFFILLVGGLLQAQTLADFEELAVLPDSFLNGSDLSGGFRSGNVFLPNSFNEEFQSWSGWAISNTTDTTTPGFLNQYSAITGEGVDSSATYGVSFSSGMNILRLEDQALGQPVTGFFITNSTYAYLSMLEGDAFAKRFGGATGDDPDFFLLTIQGFSGGALTDSVVEFYLADFRFEDNSQDYIVEEWTYVDLLSLGAVDSLAFTLTSSDVGDFGMNTPAYFCVDNIETTDAEVIDPIARFESLEVLPDSFLNGSDLSGGFEVGSYFFPNSFDTTFGSWSGWAISNTTDTTTPGFLNQYSAITGMGVDMSPTYAVSFGSSRILPTGDAAGEPVPGMYITNSTYAYLSMLEGDAFAKRFGGATGDDPDFFLLTIKGHFNGEVTEDSVDFYLADFRFEDNAQDYIVDEWTYVDLSVLGPVDSICFALSSSDVGDFGMNTPAYFCVDNFGAEAPLATNIFSPISQQLTFSIFPNPSTDFIRLDYPAYAQYSLYDLSGRQLTQVTPLTPGEEIDVRQLPSGNYMVKVEGKDTLGAALFVKE
ncbi:MAG: DUF4465 domain-containing protein [Bacteroidota bacterium]